MYNNRRGRPILPERHSRYISELIPLRELLAELEQIAIETGSERAMRLFQKYKDVYDDELALEMFYQDDEIREFNRNPGKYGHSVRVWMQDPYLRDKEMN